MTRELIPCITETYPEPPSFVKRKLALHSTSKFGLAELLRAFLWPRQPVQAPSVRSKRAKSDQAFARFSDSNMRSCLHRLNSLVCVSFLLGTSLKLGGTFFESPSWAAPSVGSTWRTWCIFGRACHDADAAFCIALPFDRWHWLRCVSYRLPVPSTWGS